ncbi:MAG: hypothetical protein J07HQX50_00736 [Haloquadratum sp. J07HQX50]|nr:MAG: hypothetical protein J07HQX50_00736 [Haloquadratum sp. J07HQX50]
MLLRETAVFMHASALVAPLARARVPPQRFRLPQSAERASLVSHSLLAGCGVLTACLGFASRPGFFQALCERD